MKKSIIVLYGSANRGKTTVLKGFIQVLMQDSRVQLLGIHPSTNDEVAIFDYKGIKVGISTSGDSNEEIKNCVKDILINKYSCDVIFTASRIHGSSVDELKKLETDYHLNWVEKLYRVYDPIAKQNSNNPYFDKINSLEVEYLSDYLFNYILKND